jgi:hypothetical protein
MTRPAFRPMVAGVAFLFGSLGLLSLAGCCQNCGTSTSPKESSSPSEVSQSADTPVAFVQDGWGDITGRIVWGGDKLPAGVGDPINIAANPDKAACEKNGPVPNEDWIINPKTKGIRDVFIWLESKTKGEKLPVHASLKDVKPAKVEIDQPACAFVAHAIGLREGQILVAKNSAAIAHNFKWTGNPAVNPGGNVLLPPGASKEIDDLKADRLPIKFECNVHPWMNGWCRVYDHPYYVITDSDGAFTIKNAPVGEWQMKIWQGSGGWLGGAKGAKGQPITVKSGENKLGDIAYPPPG